MERLSETVEDFLHWLDWLSSQVYCIPSAVCVGELWDMHASNSIGCATCLYEGVISREASQVVFQAVYCNLSRSENLLFA